MDVIDNKSMDTLIEVLKAKGFEVIGPTVRNGAIIYDYLESFSELPIGWIDQQTAGTYRITKQDDAAVFEYVVGPHSLKKFMYPPAQRIWRAKRNGKHFEIIDEKEKRSQLAFIGVRSCDLQAVSVQDKVFSAGPFIDPVYRSRRGGTLFIAVNCTKPKGTCFCVSMKSGPKVSTDFDLALTEVLTDARHYFLIEAGSEKGEELMRDMPHRAAESHEVAKGEELMARAAKNMGRTLDTTHIKELLYQNIEHPRWDDMAGRCLSCANCTMVCPTCFCSTVEEVTDLTGDHAERWRKWDSCFNMDFSYIHGGYIRPTVKARYRQWMTHKLAGWIDQFGVSGCVGCGRCIAWCPVGIDITEEMKAIRGDDTASI